VTLLALAALPYGAQWVAKDTLFRGIFGPIMRGLGGVAVNRRERTGFVERVAEEFRRRDNFHLIIATEGTRSLQAGWKSGFYRIAAGRRRAGDHGGGRLRQARSRPAGHHHASGDEAADMAQIAGLLRRPPGLSPRAGLSDSTPMILLRDLGFSRNGDPLVTGASLQLHPGWKVGLTGANGCGKSSFLGLLRGELHADRGDLERPPGWVMAHVAQDTPALPDAALDFVLDGDAELRQIERDLPPRKPTTTTSMRRADRPAAFATLRNRRLCRAGARRRLMHGLGFSDADFQRPVAEFSGGWRVRLNLARALMCRSDLLLLDEPTNHLDLDAIIWLEDWLKSYPGTLILISHDRDFLDVVTSHILAIENGKLQLFTGNYSACERARAERLANDLALAAKQKREAAHLQSYIDRFRAKASKARQAQSRIKMLADGRNRRRPRRHALQFQLPRAERLLRSLAADRRCESRLWRHADLRQAPLHAAPGQPHRPARPQRRRQIHADEAAGRRTAAAGRRARGRPQPQARLLRPAPAGTAAPGRVAAVAHDQAGAAHARAGSAQLPWRLRFPRRHGRGALRALLRRRENPAGPGADDPHRAQPAAARRADQPPRPRNARGADHRPAGNRSRHGAGVARPPPAARHLRRTLAGGRRQGDALRRRPRRLCRMAQPVARRREIGWSRQEPGAQAGSRRRAKDGDAGHPKIETGKRKLEQQIAGWQQELKLLETRLADPALYAAGQARCWPNSASARPC
jgi:ABC-type multidrug transport system ATPase subunit